MSCKPRSGGCERWATDPFVSELNRLEGRNYEHRACLDIRDRSAPQPESLYVDLSNCDTLVIERKSISWPSRYPEGHSNDHFVADLISEGLRGTELSELYTLRLPWLIEGTKRELRDFATNVVCRIRTHLSEMKSGRAIGSKETRRAWLFYTRTSDEREEEGYETGIVFNWLYAWPEYIDPKNLPFGLLESVKKIYVSCIRKFVNYHTARRILLMDPHGQLGSDPVWWREVFLAYPPPPDIQEIWSATLDWIDDTTEAWLFEVLHRPDGLRNSPIADGCSTSRMTPRDRREASSGTENSG
jgi:hypothetical protein